MPGKRFLSIDDAVQKLLKGGRFTKFITDEGRAEYYVDSAKISPEMGEQLISEEADKWRDVREVKTLYGREWEYKFKPEYIDTEHKKKLYQRVRAQLVAKREAAGIPKGKRGRKPKNAQS